MHKFRSLDALRGWAIIGVVLVHTYYATQSFQDIKGGKFWQSGQYGVQLFFLVSAFTLCYSYFSQKEKFNLKHFFLKRWFRIAPMFYLAIIYYSYENYLSNRTVLLFDLPVSITYVCNILFLIDVVPPTTLSIVPGGATIAVEFSFYMLLPFLLVYIKTVKAAFQLFVITLITAIVFTLFVKYQVPEIYTTRYAIFFYMNIIKQMPVFSLGILLFMIYQSKDQLIKIPKFCFYILILLFFISLLYDIDDILPKYIRISLLFFALGYLLLNKEVTFLVNAFIARIGMVSFSIYIIHFAVIFWLTRLHFLNVFSNMYFNLLFNFLVTFFTSFFISNITYELIEKKTIRLGTFIINKSNRTK